MVDIRTRQFAYIAIDAVPKSEIYSVEIFRFFCLFAILQPLHSQRLIDFRLRIFAIIGASAGSRTFLFIISRNVKEQTISLCRFSFINPSWNEVQFNSVLVIFVHDFISEHIYRLKHTNSVIDFTTERVSAGILIANTANNEVRVHIFCIENVIYIRPTPIRANTSILLIGIDKRC